MIKLIVEQRDKFWISYNENIIDQIEKKIDSNQDETIFYFYILQCHLDYAVLNIYNITIESFNTIINSL